MGKEYRLYFIDPKEEKKFDDADYPNPGNIENLIEIGTHYLKKYILDIGDESMDIFKQSGSSPKKFEEFLIGSFIQMAREYKKWPGSCYGEYRDEISNIIEKLEEVPENYIFKVRYD